MNNVINNQEDNIDGKRDVFISYKRENAPFVTRLYEELDRHDISAWVDLSKLHKEVGEEYQEKIRKAIDSAEYFLLIYTEHKGCSIEKSDFIINNELEYALEKRKKVLFYPQDPINLTTSRIMHSFSFMNEWGSVPRCYEFSCKYINNVSSTN